MAYFPRIGPFYTPNYEQEVFTNTRRTEISRNSEESDRGGQNFKSTLTTSFDRTSDSQSIPE